MLKYAQAFRTLLPEVTGLSGIIIAITLLLTTPAMATEGNDVFRSGYMFDSTSDHYDRHELFFNYRNHRRAFVWPWEESQQTSLDWGLSAKKIRGSVDKQDYNAERALAMLGKRFSPAFYLEGWLGMHRLKPQGDNIKAETIYSASAYLTPINDLNIQITSSRDFVYADNILPAGITQQLISRKNQLQLNWQPLTRWRAIAQSRWQNFDDGNQERYYSLDVMYGIVPDWPWVWAGIGGEKQHFTKQKASYWTPDNFSSYGLRFDINTPLSQKVNVLAALNANRINEDGSTGQGSYFSFGLEMHLSRLLYLTLQASRISSLQSGSRWTEDNNTLFLSGAFR